jgi:hypothetical protein
MTWYLTSLMSWMPLVYSVGDVDVMSEALLEDLVGTWKSGVQC